MIEFGSDICGHMESATKREWLETNGLGGFASSTVIGLNTRRYHGLLTAATKPPVGRIVMLSKLEETVVLNGQRFELSANQYSGAIHPHGFQFLRRFRLDPFPVFTYQVEGLEIEKSVFMIHGENSTVIQYRISGQIQGNVFFELRPLIAFRDYHSTTHENGSINATVDDQPSQKTIKPYSDLPSLHLAHTPAAMDPAHFWFRNFEYQVERERGLDFYEDLFSPFALKFELSGGSTAALIASIAPHDVARVPKYEQAERERRRRVAGLAPFHSDSPLLSALVAAADHYIVSRGDQKTVIAGYHWFSDWGRDTMIALPGLTLVTGRSDIARSILLEFAKHVDQGMLPNRFPDAGETPEYNTVDATLWFFEAVRAFLQYTQDYEFVRTNMYEVLQNIVSRHIRGTRYGIRMDQDGLLLSGVPGVQLTWMDAKVGEWVVTPRHGKPVEIQALWYNALRVLEHLAGKFGDREKKNEYGALADQACASFHDLFWNEPSGCLFDVVNGDFRDGAIRPNQVLAISLTNAILTGDRAKSVLDVVQRELLTPVGLRSLAPGDPQYKPRYEGNPMSRDGAYHQGTVWAWLIGPFLTAYKKVNGNRKAVRDTMAQMLAGFESHLSEAGVGQASEIFDADPPHRPAGCIAQAWSVSELLRAAVEDVFPTTGKTKKKMES